jgi:hypothetical protein
MLTISMFDLGYDENSKRILQYNMSYTTSAFNVIFEPCLFAKIDTNTIAISCNGFFGNFSLSAETGWEYIKNIFKSDYQYYLEVVKIDSEETVPLFFDNKCNVPFWTLIFKDDKLVKKIVNVSSVTDYK